MSPPSAAEHDQCLRPNTLDLRRAAIRYLHHATGCPSPSDDAVVGATLAGICRAAPNPAKKRAATLAMLRDLLAPIADDLTGRRDRALLLVGFASALRRSELAAIALPTLAHGPGLRNYAPAQQKARRLRRSPSPGLWPAPSSARHAR
jgi:hypothetical protein